MVTNREVKRVLKLIMVIIQITTVFHPLTYEGNVDLTGLDPISINAIEIQVNEFGQTPRQIFKNPHPKRFSNKITEIYLPTDNDKFVEIRRESIDNIEKVLPSPKRFSQDGLAPQAFIEEFDAKLEADFSYEFDRNYTHLPKHHKK